jgi:putative transcriptional regulator
MEILMNRLSLARITTRKRVVLPARIISLLFSLGTGLLASPVASSSAAIASEAKASSLKGMFLVARDGISDPRFKHSVLLVTQHNANGAIALMINHPTNILLSKVLPGMSELKDSPEQLYIGGPLSNAPLMLLISNPGQMQAESSKEIIENVYFSMNHRLIAELQNDPKSQIRIYSGYASWAPGQLEGELNMGVWHVHPGDQETIFQKPADSIWPELAKPREPLNWVLLSPPDCHVSANPVC